MAYKLLYYLRTEIKEKENEKKLLLELVDNLFLDSITINDRESEEFEKTLYLKKKDQKGFLNKLPFLPEVDEILKTIRKKL